MRAGNTARRWALAVIASIAVLVCPAAAQEKIGSASSISNKVEGIIPGADAQTIEVGGEVYLNELVRTGDASVARLLFLDNTDLRVGPKSEVKLDRFVYDPDRSAGSVIVRAGRGIFRFVTGSQRPQNYLIQTPIASIGVRGTIFDLLVLPDRITVILISGQIQVTTLLGRVVELTRPGTSITVFATGFVLGPRVWRGTIHVDFADAPFPYFEPVQTPVRPPARPVQPSPPPGPPARPSREPERPVKTYTPVPKRHSDDYTPVPRKHIDRYTPVERRPRHGDREKYPRHGDTDRHQRHGDAENRKSTKYPSRPHGGGNSPRKSRH
ncbi:MAG: hypothetical protein QOI40_4309 [Alphaproteobacteria bacterium]|nr:hypothetical protein [Alphaproteobacteria bacterium]